MKEVIWGTGYYASLFTLKLGRDNISFYIDKDKYKSGYFLGKKVLTPDKVISWSDLQIYVPYNYYEEISGFLKNKGLIENENFFKYNEYIYLTKEQIEKDFNRACNEVNALNEKSCKNSTAWYGRLFATKDIYKKTISSLQEDNKIVILADTPWYKKNEIEEMMNCSVVVLPLIMHDYTFLEDDDVDDLVIEDEDDESLRNLIENLIVRNKRRMKKACAYKAKRISEFIDLVLRRRKFETFVIEGSDNAISKMFRDKCKKYGVPTLFTHPGIIPGTIMIGPGGDLGDSIPSRYYNQFLKLPIDSGILSKARTTWKYLRESRINRKVQPRNNAVRDVEMKICKARPIILCLGQNDLDSSLIPYTYESCKYQSPVFESSMDSLLFLADICEKNNWNLIYKPHPMYAEFEDYSSLPSNVFLVKYSDINDIIDLADVIVTIRSSSNYIALIRHKPVLMLGYTQTRGQGCTYEAFSEQDIEPQLKMAVQQGFSEEQQNAFLEHLTRLLQYYLYDDMSVRKVRYGLQLPRKISNFFLLGEKLDAMRRLK